MNCKYIQILAHFDIDLRFSVALCVRQIKYLLAYQNSLQDVEPSHEVGTYFTSTADYDEVEANVKCYGTILLDR